MPVLEGFGTPQSTCGSRELEDVSSVFPAGVITRAQSRSLDDAVGLDDTVCPGILS